MKRVLIQENDFQKARKKIREFSKSKNKEVIFSGQSDDLNRKILEKEPIDVLLINLKGRRDRMKQRDSGFNQVLAKLAKKNNIALGINLDEIFQAKSAREKAEILARIQQNIKLAKKSKLKVRFISKENKNRDIYNLKALGIVLGMPTQAVRNL